MRYSTLGGGKRLRAFLVIETARALGRSDAGPVRAAAAIECLHAYSLIHDDLPAMDDDDLRRGRPTTSPRLRRSDRDPRRRRAADARLRDPGRPGRRRQRRHARGALRGPRPRRGPRRHGRRPDARHRRRDGCRAALDRGDRAPAGDEDRRADPVQRRGRRNARGRRAHRPWRRCRTMAQRSARPSRSPTTCSTPRATRRRSASAPARTPNKARRPWSRRSALDGARRELAALVDKAKAAIDAAKLGEAGDGLRATADFVATRRN